MFTLLFFLLASCPGWEILIFPTLYGDSKWKSP